MFHDTKKLFPVKDQEKRFHTYLCRVMQCITHIYETLFDDAKEIGSHSIRKAAATYCCAGVHPGPPIVSICL